MPVFIEFKSNPFLSITVVAKFFPYMLNTDIFHPLLPLLIFNMNNYLIFCFPLFAYLLQILRCQLWRYCSTTGTWSLFYKQNI